MGFMVMPMTDLIEATKAAYLKLGPKGRWEALCLQDGTLRLEYDDVPHEVAMAGDIGALWKHFVEAGNIPRVATSHANQVHRFYSAGPERSGYIFGWVSVVGDRGRAC